MTLFGLGITVYGTAQLAYNEPLSEQIVDNKLEEAIKPTIEKLEKDGSVGLQDRGFPVLARAIERKAPDDPDLEGIEVEETEEGERDRVFLELAEGVEESSMAYIKSAIIDYREYNHERHRWQGVRYSLEKIIAGFLIQFLGIILDRVIVL